MDIEKVKQIMDGGGVYANLKGADLEGADLEGADLEGADLEGADLEGANLEWANLERANLERVNFKRARLKWASLEGAILPDFQICPEEGSFIGFKKLSGGVICKLEIPAEAKRTSSLVGRKCRAEFVRVIDGEGDSCTIGYNKIHYSPGDVVYSDSYDPDIRVECSHGIHFFITRKEAEEF